MGKTKKHQAQAEEAGPDMTPEEITPGSARKEKRTRESGGEDQEKASKKASKKMKKELDVTADGTRKNEKASKKAKKDADEQVVERRDKKSKKKDKTSKKAKRVDTEEKTHTEDKPGTGKEGKVSKKQKKDEVREEDAADSDEAVSGGSSADEQEHSDAKEAAPMSMGGKKSAARKNTRGDKSGEGQAQGSLDEGARSVYISGLPFDFKRKDIENIFEKVGAMVTYIHMPVFEDSRRCRGFATVTFTKREYVTLALELDGSKLKGGRWLKVALLEKSKVKKNKGAKKKGAAAASEDAGGASHASGRKRRYTERPEGCNKVFVANIPLDANESEVRDLFGRCGTITSISMGKDRNTGRFAGHAFIEYEPNPEDEPTEKAYSLYGKVRIHANKLFIDYAPDSTVCFRCKSKEHLSRDCPRRQVHANKRVKLDNDE